MSLPIDAAASAPGPPIQGNGESRVIHFDATMRRKEKMRQKATGGTGNTRSNEESPGRFGTAEEVPSGLGVPAAVMPAEPANQPPRTTLPTPPTAVSVTESSVGSSAAVRSESSSKPAPRPALRGKALESFLVDFVVEQTGYPAEMVELDADLEADLGIDSIKKAQLFGELAEHFEVTENVEELSLDDFPTLRHVMDFLSRQADADPADNGKVAPSPMAEMPTSIPTATVAVQRPPAAMTTATQPAAAAELPQTSSQLESPTKSAANTGLTGQELEQFLVNFVVEQTGYPSEMVELDADLEADLGIDSIKKAQLFGELAEHFEVTANIEELSLDDFPTLRQVMNFLDGMPQQSGSTGGPLQTPAAPDVEHATTHVPQPERTAAALTDVTSTDADGDDLAEFLINFVVEQTGYPPEMVELDADLEADLGIDSIKKAQLFGELAEYFEVQVTTEELSLDDFPTLRHVMTFLQGVPRRVTRAAQAGG